MIWKKKKKKKNVSGSFLKLLYLHLYKFMYLLSNLQNYFIDFVDLLWLVFRLSRHFLI